MRPEIFAGAVCSDDSIFFAPFPPAMQRGVGGEERGKEEREGGGFLEASSGRKRRGPRPTVCLPIISPFVREKAEGK